MNKKCTYCETNTNPNGSEMEQYIYYCVCEKHKSIWWTKAIDYYSNFIIPEKHARNI